MRFRPKPSARASAIVNSLKKGAPFVGFIACAKCGESVNGEPHINLNWRCLEAEGQRFYCCSNCHPGADSAGKDAWRAFYLDFMKYFVFPHFNRPIKELLLWRETGDGPPTCERMM